MIIFLANTSGKGKFKRVTTFKILKKEKLGFLTLRCLACVTFKGNLMLSMQLGFDDQLS